MQNEAGQSGSLASDGLRYDQTRFLPFSPVSLQVKIPTCDLETHNSIMQNQKKS